jgi:hypothetical protein
MINIVAHVHDLIVQDNEFLKALQSSAGNPNIFVSSFAVEFLQKIFNNEISDAARDKSFHQYLLNNSTFINSIKNALRSVKLQVIENKQEIEDYITRTVENIDNLASIFEKEISGETHSLYIDLGFWMRMAVCTGISVGYIAIRSRIARLPPRAMREMSLLSLLYVCSTVTWSEYGQDFVRKRILEMFESRKGPDRVVITTPHMHFLINRATNFLFTKAIFLAIYHRVKYLLIVALLTNSTQIQMSVGDSKVALHM